jgi:hypothetical protein
MEYVSGKIRIMNIFLDKRNWLKFFIRHRSLIRLAIIINVAKMLSCRTSLLGFHRFVCPKCLISLIVPHTCKSRFCPSCGKKATDQWIANAYADLPDTTWQHITFTLPDIIQPIIWANRHLMNLIPTHAADIIIGLSKKKGILPGAYLAIHTFGRDLKRNFHVHLSTTMGGLSPDRKTWVTGLYFHHDVLKKM